MSNNYEQTKKFFKTFQLKFEEEDEELWTSIEKQLYKWLAKGDNWKKKDRKNEFMKELLRKGKDALL